MGRRLFKCLCKCSSSGDGSFNRRGNGEIDDATMPPPLADGPVLVELFSSQGCSKAPVGELLLSRLVRGDFQLDAPVVVLSYHVDHTGWKDPYASGNWNVRQKAYVEALNLDRVFTPRIVVQGRAHYPVDEEDALLSIIAHAPRFPAPRFKVYFTYFPNFQRPTSETLEVNLTGALRYRVDNNVDNVMVALYESGLVNECLSGENKGKVLYNDFVVRKLEKLCTVDDISAKKTLSVTVTFTLWDGFSSSKCSIVVFVQNISQQIFCSQYFQLPDDL
ncbi:Dynein light chain type 1 family protein [Hibiscus syriacus]|uniref:Dynein light chain type 1 family protein n=1 Tax=Hibiscus syriacus TaxID=106335 RepID=A0A6A3CRI5_HIBSY|nr:uncharacterized protein LOC120175840 [Hibiscus syriacus]KAE8729788.1 Dynein light chain type 1 family protein [Hibiscus syriacus]